MALRMSPVGVYSIEAVCSCLKRRGHAVYTKIQVEASKLREALKENPIVEVRVHTPTCVDWRTGLFMDDWPDNIPDANEVLVDGRFCTFVHFHRKAPGAIPAAEFRCSMKPSPDPAEYIYITVGTTIIFCFYHGCSGASEWAMLLEVGLVP